MRKLLFVLAALLSISGAVMAQDATTPEVFCGDLAEADCVLLTQSQEAMMTLESVAFDMTADFTIEGAPDVEGPVTFALTGNGAFSGDASVFDGMMGTDMTMQDPVEAMSMAAEALRAFDADVSFTLIFPAQLLEESPEVPASVTLELRFVDGLGFINLEPLEPILEEADAQLPFRGWLGLDFAGLLEALVEQNPEMFSGMDMSMSGFDPTMYAQFSDPTAFAEYATITRTDDGTGDTATFETTFDFAGLFSDPEFQSLMQEQMAAQGEDMDDEEFQMGLQAAQAMFQNSTLVATTSIDVNTGYQTAATFSMMIDTAAIAEFAEEAGEEMEATPTISVNFALNLSQFNEVPEITEPESSTVLPYESLLGMGMGSMDGADAVAPMTPTFTPEPEVAATEEG